MKGKRIALWTAKSVIVCLSVGICSIIANAAQNTETEQIQITDEVSVSGNIVQPRTVSDNDIKTKPLVNLQVPNNLDFVIDPWNLSGQGQIYSQRFEICNSGDTACILQLQNIACYSEGENGVVIVKDAEEIYATDTANVYLEMVLDTGDVLSLLEESKEYTIILEPESELTFWFTGKVNEKTSEDWMHKKVLVKLRYSGECISE